jgi:hypothetical protein
MAKKGFLNELKLKCGFEMKGGDMQERSTREGSVLKGQGRWSNWSMSDMPHTHTTENKCEWCG